MDTTAQNSAEERKSRRQETGRFRPHSFSKHVQRRFDRERRREYLDRMSRPPNVREAARIDSLVRLEWNALKAEAVGTMVGDREGREHRRLFDRLLGDYEKTIGPAPRASRARPGPPSSLPDVIAEMLSTSTSAPTPPPSVQAAEQPDHQPDLFGDSAE